MAINPSITGNHMRWILALILAGAITGVSFVHAAQDPACLQKASSDRASSIKTAYDDYNKDMRRIIDTLTKAEADALKITDLNQQSMERARINNNYSTDTYQANQTLQYKLSRSAIDFMTKQSSCGYSDASGYHGSAPWYGASSYYPYSGYSPYGSYYPSYYYSYPYSYGYNNYQFGYGYTSYGQSYCPQIVLPTVSAGCGIEWSRDDHGCVKAEVSCRNVDTSRVECQCPSYYSPVCGRDARTYTNYCFAQCADVAIQYGGACAY